MSESQPLPLLEDRDFVSVRRLLVTAGPLILSQMGVMVMQIVDGVFLAHYSEASIAAVGPAGMSFWLVCGLFVGMVGYTGTFVAQYIGAGRSQRVGAVLWQGIYLSFLSGALLFLLAPVSGIFFEWVGHADEIRIQETVYFQVLCRGGVWILLSSAISGFYAGRHDNTILMIAHLLGGLFNAIFDYLMIFGRFGFPEMGIAGAAWATIIGHVLQVAILGAWLFGRGFRDRFATWSARSIDLALAFRLIRHGFPNGIRLIVEIGAWTVFLMIVGRIDSDGLAASNIAWRINGMAFFPVIGLSIAVSMLVGQAQGAGRPDLSRKVTRRGLLVGQIWMTAAAVPMVVCPELLLRIFLGDASDPDPSAVRAITVLLLRFVAAYCLIDNVNIVLMGMLAGAGDTKWMLIVSGCLHIGFVLSLMALAWFGAGMMSLWLAATIFVFVLACAWAIRFASKAWENKQVVEAPAPDIVTPAFSGPNASEG